MRNTYLDMEKIDAQEATKAEEDECTMQRVQGTNAKVK